MDIRQAGSRWTAFPIRPSRVMKATSIGKRMNQVWMAFVGAMTRAAPDARESRPSSPLRRLAESNAVVTAWATTRPLRRLTSWYAASDFSSSGFRNTDVILTHVGSRWVLGASCYVLGAGARCSVLGATCRYSGAGCECFRTFTSCGLGAFQCFSASAAALVNVSNKRSSLLLRWPLARPELRSDPVRLRSSILGGNPRRHGYAFLPLSTCVS